MDWARILAFVTGTVDRELLARIEFPAEMEIIPVNMRDTKEIENVVTTFARSGNGSLVVTASPLALLHRNLIIELAAPTQTPGVSL
jgi:hypothetical protein